MFKVFKLKKGFDSTSYSGVSFAVKSTELDSSVLGGRGL
jgi:hypothetical protein